MVNHPGQELEHIPARAAALGSAAACWAAPIQDFGGLLVSAEPLRSDRAADHVPAEAHGAMMSGMLTTSAMVGIRKMAPVLKRIFG